MTRGISIQQWWSGKCSKPLELIVGLFIFAIAAGGGAIEHVSSTSMAALFLVSLVYLRSWPSLWRQITADERLILLGFCLYFFSAILAYYNVNDEHEYIKILDRYARFLFIVPVYLLLSKADLKLFPYLLAGAIVSGPLYLGTAFMSLAENPDLNAKGAYHHITFGDIAMLSAMFLVTVLAVMKTGRIMKMVLVASIICLLYASLLSQARGAWLALPFCLLLLLPVAVRRGKVQMRTIVITLCILAAVVAVSPAKDIVSSRVQKAVHEIELFQSGENFGSSVGSRLAMWHVAINVWKEYPVLGTGPGDYDQEFEASQAKGLYKNNVVYSSAHNIFFQALATTGTVGFVLLCLALFVFPFRLFYKTSQETLNVASVSGMVGIMAFAVFGLTESWMYRAPVVSVYLLYILLPLRSLRPGLRLNLINW